MLTDSDSYRTVVGIAVLLYTQGTPEQQACFEEWVAAQLVVAEHVEATLFQHSRYLSLLTRERLMSPTHTMNTIEQEYLEPIAHAQRHLQEAHKRAEYASARLQEMTGKGDNFTGDG